MEPCERHVSDVFNKEARMAISDSHIARRGNALLTATLVQTIAETDPDFMDRFLARLNRAYYELRDNSEESRREEMELLTWTREYLTGFSHITGPGDPWLGGV